MPFVISAVASLLCNSIRSACIPVQQHQKRMHPGAAVEIGDWTCLHTGLLVLSCQLCFSHHRPCSRCIAAERVQLLQLKEYALMQHGLCLLIRDGP